MVIDIKRDMVTGIERHGDRHKGRHGDRHGETW